MVFMFWRVRFFLLLISVLVSRQLPSNLHFFPIGSVVFLFWWLVGQKVQFTPQDFVIFVILYVFLCWGRYWCWGRVWDLISFFSFLYSVNLTEYVAMDPRVCVCLSVCVSVCLCVCVISTAPTDVPILIRLSTNHLQHICSIHFSPILKS